MERIYLDTDCILALIKDKDWLKDHVIQRLESEKDLSTSIITILECKLVIAREIGREMILDVGDSIDDLGVGIIPLNKEIETISNELLKEYPFLGIFDSIHAATCIRDGRTNDTRIA
ncbi:MAG: PIN domain-containing protein [Thermoplasmatota archaeon]